MVCVNVQQEAASNANEQSLADQTVDGSVQVGVELRAYLFEFVAHRSVPFPLT